MSIIDGVEDLKAQLPATGRLIGLDLGSKTIGIAISDTMRSIATPHDLIKRGKFKVDALALLSLCVQEEVCGIILGLPKNMDGSDGPRVQSTKAFARNLTALTDIPITYWDERLSTSAVTRTLIEADRSRARRKDLVDKMAAAYILQGALDYLTH